jgi:pSer/pThr/pTyr-binding forkhead associated (FHA) protein
MPASPDLRASLIALTPEARAALGGAELAVARLPFRVGRESRRGPRAAGRTIAERRKSKRAPTNELYLAEKGEPFNVSRDHFQIQHNGTRYILVDRQSACGTIVEGTVIGGRSAGGAVQLNDGDVIVVGSSSSPYVFKFRTRAGG